MGRSKKERGIYLEDIIKKLQREEKQLIDLRQNIEKQLQNLPDGRLKIRIRNGKPEYHIVTEDGIEKYIRKEQKALASALAQKSYLNKILSNISIQLSTIRQFLNHYSLEAISASYQELSNERKKLIKPIYTPDNQYIKIWQEQPYTGKGFAVNESEIFTERGERVRSKSEKIIADKLLMMGIPYKYECPLQLKKGGIVYPDFTLLNVKERKEIYLEHLGMMDYPEYAEKATRKINGYIKNGIIPGKNLLLTYETSKTPLDMKVLEEVLKSTI